MAKLPKINSHYEGHVSEGLSEGSLLLSEGDLLLSDGGLHISEGGLLQGGFLKVVYLHFDMMKTFLNVIIINPRRMLEGYGI